MSTKSVIVLTDDKKFTRSFQTKKLPGNLWNPVDYVLSFNLLGHISGKTNATVDFLSRIYVKFCTKLKLMLSDRIPVRDLEVEVLAHTPNNSFTALSTAVSVPNITVASEEPCRTLEINSFIESKDHIMNNFSEENPLDKFKLSA